MKSSKQVLNRAFFRFLMYNNVFDDFMKGVAYSTFRRISNVVPHYCYDFDLRKPPRCYIEYAFGWESWNRVNGKEIHWSVLNNAWIVISRNIEQAYHTNKLANKYIFKTIERYSKNLEIFG